MADFRGSNSAPAWSPDGSQLAVALSREGLERVGYMFINALAGPTRDVRVRRAIAHAINRDLLVDALLSGYGRPTSIVLTDASFGFIADIQGYPYDPARARGLLDTYGYVDRNGDGWRIARSVTTTNIRPPTMAISPPRPIRPMPAISELLRSTCSAPATLRCTP